MKRVRRPTNGARGVRRGGRAIVGLGTVYRAPALKPGQVRCHVCRNGTALKGGGLYRKHRTLTGDDCYAIRPPGEVDRVELPPVLGLEPFTPALDLERRSVEPKGKTQGVRVHGECETCGVLVSGERRFCGICLARRMRGRTE